MAQHVSPYMAIKPLLSCIFIFLFVTSFKTDPSIATDIISQGQVLSGNQTITSQNGTFELGFFTPGISHNYYIGIWYKTVPKHTVVWVANRDSPLPDASSELKISQDGNLVLLNQSKTPIWTTNTTSANSNSTVAVLLDSGNLVLRDGSNNSATIWQSFDHPTDTWLPGGKFGLNKITGEVQAFTSWRNSEDPSPGIFSYEIDRNGGNETFLYWNRSQAYWSSGVFTGQIFTSVPELVSPSVPETVGGLFSYRYVSNEKENYFTYFMNDGAPLARYMLDFTGQMKTFYWIENLQDWVMVFAVPKARCENYSLCRAFGTCYQDGSLVCECLRGFEPRFKKDWNLSDWSGGCVRKTRLQCEKNSSAKGDKDRFLMMPNMRYPKNSQSLGVWTAKECELTCLNNCSCTAFAYNGSGCFIWNGDLLNLQQSSGGDLYLRLAASELPKSRPEEWKVVVAIIAGAGVVAILGLCLMLIWSRRRRCEIKKLKALPGSLVQFSYRELQTATKNFSEKLGGGGFGYVFKGALPDLTGIAVKKLGSYTQGEKQFRAEVSTIGMIQHLNLVRLQGFCAEGTKRLLVYDYMPKGSLDSYLFQKNSIILDWKTRYQIAVGIARGLAYLHDETRECIIHCDIKPENILLDDTFCPKVADFGLAKLVGREFSRVLTTMRGTRGYLAPEWLSGLAITKKADVYSYGMMLFEIISGKRNTSEESEDTMASFFPLSAARKINEGNVSSLLDCRLHGEANMKELSTACRVACWCIQDNESHRPSMGLVVQFLEGILEVEIPPISRFLQILVGSPENTNYLSADSSNQPQINVSTHSQSKIPASTSSMYEEFPEFPLAHISLK